MKVAFLFSPYICPRVMDFNDLWTNPRGLSGSDLGVVRVAEEMSKKGHQVSMFVNQVNKIDSYQNIKLYDFDERLTKITSDYDAIITWCDPNALSGLVDGPVKMVSGQLNNFSWCQPGFDNWVDIWTSPSQIHMEYQKSFNVSDPNKWVVVPNGCDPELYTDTQKKEGRVIWASSADRGLHLLLQEWSKIKQAVPAANLRILYNFNYGDLEKFEKGVFENTTSGPSIMELAQRIRYMKEMIVKLKHLDVELVGSVSREQIKQEWNEAMVMAFPCDTVAFTEGFSVSILEGCASYSCPIISDVDALGGVYKDVVPMVKSPVRKNIQQFTDLVIKGLTDKDFRDETNKRCRAFAETLTWKKIADQYESLLLNHPKYNKSIVETKVINMPLTNISLPITSLVKLNIASGPNVFPSDGWVNFDREDISSYLSYMKRVSNLDGMPEHQKTLANYLKQGGTVDFRIHDIKQPFNQYPDNSVDLIYLGQCVEHFAPLTELPNLLTECRRMLKPNGVIRITTPDLDLLIGAYINNDMGKFASEQPDFYKEADSSSQLAMLMYGSMGPNCSWNSYEGHMFLYTKQSMTRVLEGAGFKNVEFHYETGKSKSEVMAKEAVDAGLSHSFVCEAIK
jgi:glycosyltransferase involved in cell wall biosynthesis/SAM-dependent methyltransferase